MKDLVFFLYFIFIFMAGYAVTSYALITTNHQVFWNESKRKGLLQEFTLSNNGSNVWRWGTLRRVINWGIWKVYGQVELEATYKSNGNTNVVQGFQLKLEFE